jgi:hypothetical protein
VAEISDNSDVVALIRASLFPASGVCRQRAEVETDFIEYRICGGPPDGWKIFRQDVQIGVLSSILGAVCFATYFAEREAALGENITKVAMNASVTRLHACMLREHRLRTELGPPT